MLFTPKSAPRQDYPDSQSINALNHYPCDPNACTALHTHSGPAPPPQKYFITQEGEAGPSVLRLQDLGLYYEWAGVLPLYEGGGRGVLPS